MNRTKIRVLYIEDDVVDQMAFKQIMKEEARPLEYQIAGSLAEARKLIDSESFDIILCDYLLGDGMGTEILGWQQDAPVVMVTGSGSENVAVEAMKMGAYNYLVKDNERRYLNMISVTIENTLLQKKTEKALKKAERDLQEHANELELRNKELALLSEAFRLLSIIDPLTGLFNRRSMETVLEKEVSQAVRQQWPLSVIMIDIDHFKRVNDTFGHEAGDLVLQELGRHLMGSIRMEDVACRYGGEEFCLILPNSASENAQQRAEEMIGAFKRLPLNYNGIAIGPVTISAGVAAYPKHGSTPHDLLKASDNALYRAKSEGRDKVVTAD